MKATVLFAAAALSSLFALSANAEQYQGVLQFQSTASRADVRAGAVAAAHSEDRYSEGAMAGLAPELPMDLARKDVRAGARAAAQFGDPYGDGVNASMPEDVSPTL